MTSVGHCPQQVELGGDWPSCLLTEVSLSHSFPASGQNVSPQLEVGRQGKFVEKQKREEMA